MVKYLEHDYELDRRPTGFIPHFFETLEAIGGVFGITLLFAGILAFYIGVTWFVNYSRAKRDAKKKR
jgi:hypothetical protein